MCIQNEPPRFTDQVGAINTGGPNGTAAVVFAGRKVKPGDIVAIIAAVDANTGGTVCPGFPESLEYTVSHNGSRLDQRVRVVTDGTGAALVATSDFDSSTLLSLTVIAKDGSGATDVVAVTFQPRTPIAFKPPAAPGECATVKSCTDAAAPLFCQSAAWGCTDALQGCLRAMRQDLGNVSNANADACAQAR